MEVPYLQLALLLDQAVADGEHLVLGDLDGLHGAPHVLHRRRAVLLRLLLEGDPAPQRAHPARGPVLTLKLLNGSLLAPDGDVTEVANTPVCVGPT